MNRIFKIIYNRARDLYMVGSENLRTHAGKTGVAVAAIALCSSAFAADPFEYTGSRWYGMGYWQDTDQKYSSVNILLNTNGGRFGGVVLGSTRLDVTDKNSPSVVTVNGLSSPTVMRGISLSMTEAEVPQYLLPAIWTFILMEKQTVHMVLLSGMAAGANLRQPGSP